MTTRCHACGAPRAAVARYCGSCGAPTREHARATAARHRDDRGRQHRAAAALAVACVGTLALLVLPAALDWNDGWLGVLAFAAGLAAITAAVTAITGWRGAAQPLATAPPRWLLAAVPAGLVTFAASYGYVALLRSGFDVEPAEAPARATLVAIVAVAPLLEELLCRGAAWRAARRLAGPHATIAATAVLFAFLHALGGGYLLGLPHRFASGLVFGWLRWRSDSVWPGVVAHALHNVLAVVL